MKRIAMAGLLLLLAATTAPAGPNEFWVHVKVQELEGDQEVVRVNLPINTVNAILPAIHEEGFRHGKFSFDGDEIEGVDLRRMLQAVRDAEDGEYVTVESKDESVRVAKEKGVLVIHVVDTEEDHEEVWIRLRMEVVDALLSGDSDELDIAAALRALGEHGGGEFVSVVGTDANIRVWVDKKSSGD